MTIQIIRYRQAGRGAAVGLRDGSGAVRPLDVPSIAHLLAMPLDELRRVVESTAGRPLDVPVDLLPPVDGHVEVWAAGVTYRRSNEARQEESSSADVYARVYDAERPELFFKAPAWRVCGDGEPIGVRADSAVDVPEAELAVVCNAAGEIVGLTVCDDVSSRTIEGENPLYLPQAKIYSGSCALGPGIVPIWAAPDPGALDITVTVRRAEAAGGAVAWTARTSTALLHRTFADLVGHLFRQATFPCGVVLSTGTGAVPDLDFTLLTGDVVTIEVPGVGTLTNPVRPADTFGWLTPDPDRAPGQDRP